VPVHRGVDRDGPYYQWGGHGKKYRYEAANKASRDQAKRKAERQAQAAHAHGYRE
jgi:hypothetical protein